MKTAREVLSYCYGHGRIVDHGRYGIAMSDLDRTMKEIAAKDKEIERLKKCESDLRKIHEEQYEAVKKAQMGFQYIGRDLVLVSLKGE